MSATAHKQTRLTWVDNTKIFACLLVGLGHLFPSLIAPGILPSCAIIEWFQHTVYTFHVPLFFICSGYLYQQFTKLQSGKEYGIHILNKLLALGIPYFVFSFATWLMKTLFSSSVNSEIGGLFETLFLSPTAPYWYLYVLFFLFVLVLPARNNTHMWILVAASVCLKGLYSFSLIPKIYLLSAISCYAIWFIIGMCMSHFKVTENTKTKRIVLAFFISCPTALSISIMQFVFSWESNLLDFTVGFFACIGVIAGIMLLSTKWAAPEWLIHSIMPIYLTHTIFAAGVRVMLLKLNLTNGILHLLFGFVFSFAVPIFVAQVGNNWKWIDFLFFPTKYIKFRK